MDKLIAKIKEIIQNLEELKAEEPDIVSSYMNGQIAILNYLLSLIEGGKFNTDPCNYCNENQRDFGDNFSIAFKLLSFSDCSVGCYGSAQINYCPMCGRKLEVQL